MATSISERRLRLTTNNPQAEILLLDGGFRVLARGTTPLEHPVAPGLYAMKVKIGDEETEALIAVEPGQQAQEEFLCAPAFESPIPLADTSTTHEYHQSAADRFLQPSGLGLSLGSGSAVMVCVRDPSRTNFSANDADASPQDRAAYAASFKGFRLLDATGVCLVDLDEQAEHNLGHGYMALTVELAPGSYALAYQTGSEWLCTPLPTAGGWTLQVYINVVSSGKGRFQLQPDLSGMALVFGRMAQGFTPRREDLLAEETVRKGLLDGRNYVDTPSMRELLSGKFENPMLGLYAAHLLLLEPAPRLDLIREVIQNAAGMLGEQFPDVAALTTAYEKQAGLDQPANYPEQLSQRLGRLTGPPLLTRSWELLFNASKRLPSAAIASAAVFAVAGNVVAQGVFLAWRRPSLQTAANGAGPELAAATAPEAFRSLASISITVSSEPLKSSTTLLSIAGKVADYSRPLISVVTKIWNAVSKARAGAGQPSSLATQIAQADSEEKVAAALREMARRYDWQQLLTELRKEPERMSRLSGLQRDLLLMLRDISGELHDGEPGQIEAITGDYVARLLEAHRIPLSALVQALADTEFSGWMTEGVQDDRQA